MRMAAEINYRCEGGKWVPDWSDHETCMCIIDDHIVVSDLIALPWLEAFATGVATHYSLPNPYLLKPATKQDFTIEMHRAFDNIEEGLNIDTAKTAQYIGETSTFLCKVGTAIVLNHRWELTESRQIARYCPKSTEKNRLTRHSGASGNLIEGRHDI